MVEVQVGGDNGLEEWGVVGAIGWGTEVVEEAGRDQATEGGGG